MLNITLRARILGVGLFAALSGPLAFAQSEDASSEAEAAADASEEAPAEDLPRAESSIRITSYAGSPESGLGDLTGAWGFFPECENDRWTITDQSLSAVASNLSCSYASEDFTINGTRTGSATVFSVPADCTIGEEELADTFTFTLRPDQSTLWVHTASGSSLTLTRCAAQQAEGESEEG
jgi:hypothetical protein